MWAQILNKNATANLSFIYQFP